ncbi:MAG: pentapeptide repeat-containing protein [Pseudomonadota bacterium]
MKKKDTAAVVGQKDVDSLRSRWFIKDPDTGLTARETMLEKLKTECRPENSQRPVGLDLRGISLINEDLKGLDLSLYDFSHANLNRSNLAGSNVSYCRFQGASLEKACLDECEFLGSDLSHASLNECTANRTGFGGTDLSNTSMIGAQMNESTLSQSKLVDADLRAVSIRNSRITETDLSGSLFTRAVLQGSDLKNSNVLKASFDLADMRDCRLLGIRNFASARWIGTDIRGLDLRGAYLVRRHIADENYLYEFKTRSRSHGAIYWIWWFTSDCGRSLLRWFVWLLVVTFVFAGIYTQVAIDYGDYRTVFSPVYFSIVTLTTLGYGDAIPMSLTAQIFVTIQAFTGYMGLGGLLSILGNKMARRSE